MLKLQGISLVCQQLIHRAFHSSTSALADRPVKAVSKGYKQGIGGKKNKKSTGSHKFFQEYVSTGKLSEKAGELDVPLFENGLSVNQVVQFTDKQLKRLIQLGSFKKDQFNELFSKPITLIRNESKVLESFIEKANRSSSNDNKIVLHGEAGIGKSSLLTQAQALLTIKDAIILPISYALQLVNGSNDYWYDQSIKSFIQPMYLKKLLNKIKSANKSSLSEIKLSQNVTIESPIKGRQPLKFTTNHTLLQLLEAKAHSRQRGQVFQILISELSQQDRIPVYFTVDNFSALTANSLTAYRDSTNSPIHVESLQITKILFELINGDRSFKRGGIILATSSDDKHDLTLKVGLKLVEANPYAKSKDYNHEISVKLQNLQVLEVDKLTKENVASLVQKFIEADIFRKDELKNNTPEALTDQKYILSGNGNPLELFKSVTMSY